MYVCTYLYVQQKYQIFCLNSSPGVPLKSLEGKTIIKDPEGILKRLSEHFMSLIFIAPSAGTIEYDDCIFSLRTTSLTVSLLFYTDVDAIKWSTEVDMLLF